MLATTTSALAFSVCLAAVVSGFSFTFTSEPQQCANLSLSITGAGTPPYSVLIIPYGPSPLPNNVEARTIVYEQFPGNSSSVSFQLKYPSTSQFVTVVSDSSGFGTGGTSVAATVMSSSDSSCYNATENVSPDFPFNIVPSNQVVQCSPSRLWWDPSQVQGTVSFQGVIPGGQSFAIPAGTLSQVADEGTGFNWTASVRAGTTLILVAGDGRGLGSGGSGLYNVAAGLYPDSSCLSNSSPSSTAGPPAGGSYPTDVSGDQTPGNSSHSSNVGAIVGGVVGGLVFAALLVLAGLYIIRRKTSSSNKEQPVDLLHGDPDDSDQAPPPDLPEYRPEPFLATEPTEASSSYQPDDTGRLSVAGSRYGALSDRPLSTMSLSEMQSARSGTPDRDMRHVSGPSASMVTSSRKSPQPRQLRPVNIIQHEDAGPSEVDSETIELPPAYTNINRKTTQAEPEL
ncbi:hypothetical protein F5J12DRAFT_813617 [Pisolithus orientalis]|uniref:uncharacterized protein n=1 Tax=Pisolithus orientalis TaxID=936130 RepID=UPI0022252E4B|nr:uncharacterized protein F5J12DRAFT_813617 [Pisolithus orientalis]KAI6019848.1 hypothetical protein F5J12DRAFT_813617 [Pisolithus orientalis]